jgi:hypothetical protein
LKQSGKILSDRFMTDKELKQLVESNARTIQAMLEQQATDRLRHEERMDAFERRTDELQNVMIEINRIQNGLARILGSLDEDRPIILRRLMSIENKLDRLIEDR